MKRLSSLILATLAFSGLAKADEQSFSIQQAHYLGNDRVAVFLNYNGGCAFHQFELEVSDICTFSNPRQCLAQIVDRSDSPDTCNDPIEEVRVFEIDPQLASFPTILKIRAADGQITNVDLQQAESVVQDQIATIHRASIDPDESLVGTDRFAVQLTAEIMLGGNPCQAAGVTASLRQQVVGDQLVVEAIRHVPVEAFVRICTLEYRPVFTQVSLLVSGQRDQIDEIVLRNLRDFETDYIYDVTN